MSRRCHPLPQRAAGIGCAGMLALLVGLGVGGGSGLAAADGPKSGDTTTGVATTGSVEAEAAAAFAGRVLVAETQPPGRCPLPSSRTGLCGTVAGSRGWYGSWDTAGETGAWCLQHAGTEPRAELAYERHPGSQGHAPITPPAAARLGYLLSRYGATRDPVRAAALAILAHAAAGDTLTTEDLATYRSDLDPRVRSTARALWQEAGELHGPYRVEVSFTGPGSAVLHVASASGRGVPGLAVSWGGSTVVATAADDRTDAAGDARLRFTPGSPGAEVAVTPRVSGLPANDVAVWVPHDRGVQTVAVGLPTEQRQARATQTTPPPPPPPPVPAPPATASVTVVKTTDNPWVSPAGAAFHLTRDDGTVTPTMTTGPDGRTPPWVDLPAGGAWTLTEDIPCRDCLPAPPTEVTVPPGPVELPVLNRTERHHLTLRKTAPDGTPLAGAVLRVRSAPRPGAGYDDDRGSCTTATDGTCSVAPEGLPSGAYQVTEEQPAPGTVPADAAAREVQLDGSDAEVVLVDRRLTTVGFRKSADAEGSVVDPAHVVLGGAVLVVSTAEGEENGSPSEEVGRCTTGDDGRCTLPAAVLVEGRDYRWAEIAAPPGLLPVPGSNAFTATWCGQPCVPAELAVRDRGAWVTVSLRKHQVDHPEVTVPGAIVDLCAAGLPPALAATWSPPAGVACAAEEHWVGSTTTGPDGRAGFGLLPPSARYCARERTAPPGWLLADQPVCRDVGEDGPREVELTLLEERAPPAVAVAVAVAAPTAAPPPPTAAPPTPAPRRPAPHIAGPNTPPAPATTAPQPPHAAPPILPLTGAAATKGFAGAGFSLLAVGGLLVVLAARRPRPKITPAAPPGVAPTWRGGWVPGADGRGPSPGSPQDAGVAE